MLLDIVFYHPLRVYHVPYAAVMPQASVGDAASSQASGAYIFRPNRSQDRMVGPEPRPGALALGKAFPVFTGLPFMRVFRGPLADEVQ